MSEWIEKYNAVLETPPKQGDILSAAVAGESVNLVVEMKEGSAPFVYGRAHVPEVVGPIEDVKWVLKDADTGGFYGWKAILLPRARGELLKKCEIVDGVVSVKSLRVIRPSQSGKSLLCEVCNY